MALSVGIVGLPNVGKSTLFNALSEKQAEAANYAFCTIDPNVGIVPVPDPRFDRLVELYGPKKVVPASVEFVDIAGLVKGASKGEGKGNAFLSNIRDADAVAHVVRCFEDENILHVDNRIDPLADIETIETELILKDLETVQKRLEKAERAAKGQDAFEKKALEVCKRLADSLNEGKPASATVARDEDEALVIRDMFLLTNKPSFFVANVKDEQLADIDADALVAQVQALGKERGVPVVVISAEIESEIMQLAESERAEFIESLGLDEPGLHKVIRTGYETLDLITYFTAGEPEVHAWTIDRGTKAPQAAGKIHSDFERGFIRAEVMKCEDLFELGSEQAVKAAGKLGIEGKDYVVLDGDIMHFRFNV
ncbi:MAG: redox-regulated ATPase YchF [Deltaproteobacteria bacterium]|nr:redox-regulated ATPase YchF [Deltaproteobacteria bacterium]NND29887.1 redox-regulated ATPase YchF [Myxococcales bacterium]MBT8463888.1 redox-regulated ATPase YchF [Deltaproteobacteria bacterium]MBT8481657.1 redox-regulated ATPase YchF [Deltaproteobacteria bacterium]NNK08869.1 redox-regulated ATPase YchF [Myxococcales bacterium]